MARRQRARRGVCVAASEIENNIERWGVPMNYEFDLADCDVREEHKESVKQFRAKRATWLGWLDSAEPNSIDNQIHYLMWWDATFWSLNEARKYADDEKLSSARTPILAEFLNQGYLALQIHSISKLIEKNPSNPKKGIISLRRLVDELIAHSQYFTRENYVCHDGLPFDPEPEKQRFFEANGAMPLAQAGPKAWAKSEIMHRGFDRLAKTTEGKRSRDDEIHPHIFESLRAALEDDSFAHILDLRHKIFAHAADATSQAEAKNQIQNVELSRIERAQKILCQLLQTISANILCGPVHTSTIAIPQFDQWRFVEQPYVHRDDRQKISKFWNDHCSNRNGWLLTAADDILFR
jgi:hypothetical protein